MNRIVIISLLLVLPLLTVANEIDKLKTRKDVKKFLVEKIDTNFKHYSLVPHNKGETSQNVKALFFKIDIDGNGLTDLFINGENCFAILDMGNGHYNEDLSFRAEENLYRIAEAIHIGDIPALVVQGFNEFDTVINYDVQPDTLIFMHGSFTEYNSNPACLKIEEINFKTNGGEGWTVRPAYELKIDADRKAVLSTFTSQKRKNSTAIIDTESFKNLLQTINYINLTSLRYNYGNRWSDQETIVLEIRFNNGQIKRIQDRGACGTFGLKNLYKQLFHLQATQRWKVAPNSSTQRQEH